MVVELSFSWAFLPPQMIKTDNESTKDKIQILLTNHNFFNVWHQCFRISKVNSRNCKYFIVHKKRLLQFRKHSSWGKIWTNQTIVCWDGDWTQKDSIYWIQDYDYFTLDFNQIAVEQWKLARSRYSITPTAGICALL